jgi:hypothetical protein
VSGGVFRVSLLCVCGCAGSCDGLGYDGVMVRWSGGAGVVAGYLILFVVVYYNVEDEVVCARVRVIDM